MGGIAGPFGMVGRSNVVPFPRTRHVGFVAKHAANIAGMPADRGDKYLAHQLNRQRETMARRGIPPETIQAEIRSLELAIRAKLWAIVLTPGGAA